jgi:phosphatidylserine decarboxylase
MGRLKPFLFDYIPRKYVSEVIGKISNLNYPAFQRRLIRWFIKKYNVNTEEILLPPEQYRTLGEFFVRDLKEGVRNISDKKIVAPVDGVVTECGKLGNGVFICKGEELSVRDLLHNDEFLSEFKEGYYTIHYLSPRDYHWIHSPVDGEIYKVVRLKGDLYPVFDEMVCRKKDIFCINERLNVFIRADGFKICVSMIAAMGVGNVVFRDDLRSLEEGMDRTAVIKKGDKLAMFALGSTVVLVFDKLTPDMNLKGEYIKLGTGISLL